MSDLTAIIHGHLHVAGRRVCKQCRAIHKSDHARRRADVLLELANSDAAVQLVEREGGL